jgi:hypothetical protein
MSEEQASPAVPRPPRHKQSLVTWIGVYPALTLTLYLLGPVIEGWPLPLRTLLVSSDGHRPLVVDPAIPDADLPKLAAALRPRATARGFPREAIPPTVSPRW